MDVLIKRIGKTDTGILARVAEDVFDQEITNERLAGRLDQSNQMLCVALGFRLGLFFL